MELAKINESLADLYRSGERLIFWHDEDQEFEGLLDQLSLDDVELIRLDQESSLAVKHQIAANIGSKYLFYAPFEVPSPENDWLLDLRLWGYQFAADKVSILFAELGLVQQSLKSHLKLRKKFLASKERVDHLKRLLQANDDADDIDRKILAVITHSDQPDFFNILIALLSELDADDLDTVPAIFEEISKYELSEYLQALVTEHFELEADAVFLNTLLLRLFVSELSHHCNSDLPSALGHLAFDRRGRANSAVCLAQWRDSATRNGSYESLANAVAVELRLDGHISGLTMDDLAHCVTFLQVDHVIAKQIRDQLIGTVAQGQFKALLDLVSTRKDGFWVSKQFPDTKSARRTALRAVYDAITAAVELLELEQNSRLEFSSADVAFKSYQKNWFRFDQTYRCFGEQAIKADSNDWDILKALTDRIENVYGNGFLSKLALGWGKLLEQGLLKTWKIKNIPNQQDFYNKSVMPILAQGEDRRVFVVISDALRYEAAEELTRELNGRYRIEAKLDAQLGVLPSYTALGMAALLPHKTLAYNEKGEIELDGKSCAGLDKRKKVLESFQGTAIKSEAFMKMTKDEGRAMVKPHRLVYIYHDRIDATGDTASTESQTFEAVSKTIRELGDIVRKIINSLNGGHVFVTADHGFLFQTRAPDLTDKSKISKPSGVIKAKKRYVLGRNMGEHPSAYCGSTFTTAGAEGEMEYWVPKGNNRFHFVGGARFIHGGAMLQEIVVPLIRVQHTRGAKGEKTRTKVVGVSVLGINFKITTNRHIFSLIQNEAVTSRTKPATLKVGVYDGEDRVSNVETISFESTSTDMNEWKKKLRLTLQARPFDSRKTYQLILREAVTGVEAGRYDVSIDLAFSNDF